MSIVSPIRAKHRARGCQTHPRRIVRQRFGHAVLIVEAPEATGGRQARGRVDRTKLSFEESDYPWVVLFREHLSSLKRGRVSALSRSPQPSESNAGLVGPFEASSESCHSNRANAAARPQQDETSMVRISQRRGANRHELLLLGPFGKGTRQPGATQGGSIGRSVGKSCRCCHSWQTRLFLREVDQNVGATVLECWQSGPGIH